MEDQVTTNVAGAGMAIGMLIFMLVFWLVFYIFFCICIKKIAEKGGYTYDSAITAYIPILNLVPLTKIIDKPAIWIFMFMIPLVNIIAWMEVAKKLKREQWVGIVAGLFSFIGYIILAFTDIGATESSS